MFGDVCMVFSPDYVKPMTIIAPMDTGMWVMQCNHSANVFPRPPPCDEFGNETSCEQDGWGCHWNNGSSTKTTTTLAAVTEKGGSAGGGGEGGGFCGDWGCSNMTTAADCQAMGKGQGSCIWGPGRGGGSSTCHDNPYAGHHHGPMFGGGNNCSVPDWDNATGVYNLGTLQHFNHVLLAGTRWWNLTIAEGTYLVAFDFMYLDDAFALCLGVFRRFHFYMLSTGGASLYQDS